MGKGEYAYDDGASFPSPLSGRGARGEAPHYDLEVDLAAHPYQALHVAERREWLLSLTPEALHLTASHAALAAGEDLSAAVASGTR